MPYIKPEKRPDLDKHLLEVIGSCRGNAEKAVRACCGIAIVALTDAGIDGLSGLISELQERCKADGKSIGGDVNYCLSRFAFEWAGLADPRYFRIEGAEMLLVAAEETIRSNEEVKNNRIPALAALRLVARELYRRVAVSYERVKCEENGDVFPLPLQESNPAI